MRKNKVTKNSSKTKEKMSRNKILLIIVCIFMALVLIFGITFGIILAVRNSRSVFSYKGVRIEKGECAYFASVRKSVFLNKYAKDGAVDTPEFWSSSYDADTTYGELLEADVESYIKEIAVKNYLFDRYCELDAVDEIKIKKAINEVLEFRADGSEDKFNEIYAEHGFDFDDFKNAAELLYKEKAVKARIYGENGENMQSFPESCDEYFENYSHVKLLFIRTEDKFELDSKGNRVVDENGEDKLIPLTDSEKAEVQTLLSEIRALITAYEEKTNDVRMTPEYFTKLLSEHGTGDPERINSGYYFSAESSFTAGFYTNEDNSVDSERFEIVKSSLLMETESYRELSYSGGVCFIYKYANVDRAYTDTSEDGFFSDFYSLAASAAFSEAVGSLSEDVKVSGKFSDIDAESVPYKNIFVPGFE